MFLSAPSLFFMEKEDVYPAPFLIPSSPSVHVVWDQPSDGRLKTSITTLKVLACVPWAQIHMHAERRMWEYCTRVSHPSHDGRALLWTSTPIFSQENLKLSCGHLYKLQVMKVCDSQYGSVMAKWVILLPLAYCGNPDCCHTIKPLVGSHNKLESCIKKGLIGESRKGVEKWAAGGGTGKDEKATVTRRAGWNGHHLQLMICP